MLRPFRNNWRRQLLERRSRNAYVSSPADRVDVSPLIGKFPQSIGRNPLCSVDGEPATVKAVGIKRGERVFTPSGSATRPFAKSASGSPRYRAWSRAEALGLGDGAVGQVG